MTGLRLAATIGGCPFGFAPVIGLTLFQTLRYLLRERSARAFPVQVRLGDLAGLLAGLWGPLAFFHRIQLAGTTAAVVADDCPMARIVLLLPWNLRTPLSSPADHHPGCRMKEDQAHRSAAHRHGPSSPKSALLYSGLTRPGGQAGDRCRARAGGGR